MRILSCLARSYYGDPVAVNPFYYYFVEIPRRMGHEVFYFDHVQQARLDKASMNDFFLCAIRGGNFDCVLVETVSDEFLPDVLDMAKTLTCTVAFNSDDDFRWLDFSSQWVGHYSYMVTTYRHIYEAVRQACPNVLLSPWASGWAYDGVAVAKDIGVSFVGGIHADRARRIAELRKQVPIESYGHGTQTSQATYGRFIKLAGKWLSEKVTGRHGAGNALRNWLLERLGVVRDGIGFEEVNALWNRSKISFTPLNLSESQAAQKLNMAQRMGKGHSGSAWDAWTSPMQIKGRVFELGSTGTLLLCDRNPAIDEYYARGKEYEDFETLDECVDKIRFYLAHEDARHRIARAYYDRTKCEHTWEHRLNRLFSQTGLLR